MEAGREPRAEAGPVITAGMFMEAEEGFELMLVLWSLS